MKNLAIALLFGSGVAVMGCGGSDSPPADPTKSAVTFEVDLVSKVDGTNNMSAVNSGEKVFLAGDFGQAAAVAGCDYNEDTFSTTKNEYVVGTKNLFPCWKPQVQELAMNDAGNGKYTLTLNIKRGTAMQFKAMKTMNSTCSGSAGKTGKDLVDTCGWSNGIKHYKTSTSPDWGTGCTNFNTETKGLFEVANFTFTVPDAATSTAPVIKADAWRDYAQTLVTGLKACD